MGTVERIKPKNLLRLQLAVVAMAAIVVVGLIFFGARLVDQSSSRLSSESRAAIGAAQASAQLGDLNELMSRTVATFLVSETVALRAIPEQVRIREELLRTDNGSSAPDLDQIEVSFPMREAVAFQRTVDSLLANSQQLLLDLDEGNEADQLIKREVGATLLALNAYVEKPTIGNFRRLYNGLSSLRDQATGSIPELAAAAVNDEEQLNRVTDLARAGAVFVAVILGGLVLGVTIVVGRHMQSLYEDAERERETLSKSTDRLQHLNQQLNGLYNVFTEITDTLSLRYVVSATVREALNLVDADSVVLRLLQDGYLVVAANQSRSGEPVPGLEPVVLGDGVVGRVAKRGRTLRINSRANFQLPPGQWGHNFESGIVVPLIVGARVLGTLGCWSAKPSAFGAEDERILEMMASQVATAVAAANMTESSERRAHQDALTGLPNRLQLTEDAESLFNHTPADDRAPSVVAMVDIDHFKRLNDEFGHRVGDVTLQKIAAVMRTAVRDTDRIYRYGGEEFVIIFPDAGYRDAIMLAERVRLAVEATPLTGDGLEPVGPVTISIGLAVLPDDSADFNTLVEMADSAMYRSKQAGRNRVTLWSNLVKETAVA